MALDRRNVNDDAAPRVDPDTTVTSTSATPADAGGNALRALLTGLGLLALVGLGVGVWSYKNQMTPGTEEPGLPPAITPPVSHKKTATKPTPVKVPVVTHTGPTPVSIAPVNTPVPANARANTVKGVGVRPVPAGAAGFAPANPKGPMIKPDTPGKAPNLVPEHGVPTPVQPPAGMAANPGQHGSRSTITIVKPVATDPPPAVKAQIKRLWTQGAEAKQRKDYKTARQLWEEALKLAPANSDSYKEIQDAINKLPA